jgi:hypothetical protein
MVLFHCVSFFIRSEYLSSSCRGSCNSRNPQRCMCFLGSALDLVNESCGLLE